MEDKRLSVPPFEAHLSLLMTLLKGKEIGPLISITAGIGIGCLL